MHVLFGSSAGLTSHGGEFWHQNTKGVRGDAWSRRGDSGKIVPGEQLGREVTVGDFNNDGFGDVVASAVRDDVVSRDRTTCVGVCEDGAVNVLYGTSSGTNAAGDDYWHIDTPGVDGAGGQYFGSALASRDVDRDGDDDLAIGIPGMRVADMPLAGAVLVLRGRAGGLHEDDDKLWTLNTPGVRGQPSRWAAFGADVAIRPMGRSRAPELVVGAPGQDVNGHLDAGRVSVLYGSSGGPTAEGDQLWSQFTPGVTGTVGLDGGRFWRARLRCPIPECVPLPGAGIRVGRRDGHTSCRRRRCTPCCRSGTALTGPWRRLDRTARGRVWTWNELSNCSSIFSRLPAVR